MQFQITQNLTTFYHKHPKGIPCLHTLCLQHTNTPPQRKCSLLTTEYQQCFLTRDLPTKRNAEGKITIRKTTKLYRNKDRLFQHSSPCLTHLHSAFLRGISTVYCPTHKTPVTFTVSSAPRTRTGTRTSLINVTLDTTKESRDAITKNK